MINRNDETILAVATPNGDGAISIIRVSGENAIVCVPKRNRNQRRHRFFDEYWAHHSDH